jgi:hypothetical protein
VNRSPLSLCPTCARHVRIDEPACPFCGAGLPAAFAAPPAVRSAARLNRAALAALRMGAIGVTAAACGGTVTGGTSADSGPDAQSSPPGMVVDGSEGSDGEQPGTLLDGSDVIDDAAPSGIDAAYGAPGFGILYGAFAFDASRREPDAGSAPSDAGTEEDVRNIVPYGLPPVN